MSKSMRPMTKPLSEQHPAMRDDPPPHNEVLIIRRSDGKADQCEVRNGFAYLWRYKSTDEVFCAEQDIIQWRGCTGFDF